MEFIKRNLEPSDRIGETLFGLIMALGFTGAVRLGMDDTSSHELLIAILGCNIAWGLVDGVMYVMLCVFERGRAVRMARLISGLDEAGAMHAIENELDGTLTSITTPDERAGMYRVILSGIRRAEHRFTGIHAEDLLGGLAVAILITMMTLPVVAPFALIADSWTASRVSNGVALVMLFILGLRWGKFAGVRPWATGVGMIVVGLVLVGITIALGG